MTVRHRLLFFLSVASLVGALVVALASMALIRGLVRERSVERIRSETALLAAWIEQDLALDPQAFADRAAGRLNLRVTLIDAGGTVVYDWVSDDPKQMPNLDEVRSAVGSPVAG